MYDGSLVFLLLIFAILIIISSIANYFDIKTKTKNNSQLDEKKKNAKLKSSKIGLILWILITILLYLNFVVFNIRYMTSNIVACYKPIIYLYPEEQEKVTVKLKEEKRLTHTYPKYENSWEVIANPNGDLIDLKTNRSLYGLYWEGVNTIPCDFEDGFCVKGKDTIAFLEEKLDQLGLTQREANEFIIYWLPKLENNEYNLIRFQSIEDINKNMPLEISPKPDTIIRVLMEYKPVNQFVEIKEQKLSHPQRNGFTVVEWGGTQVNN